MLNTVAEAGRITFFLMVPTRDKQLIEHFGEPSCGIHDHQVLQETSAHYSREIGKNPNVKLSRYSSVFVSCVIYVTEDFSRFWWEKLESHYYTWLQKGENFIINLLNQLGLTQSWLHRPTPKKSNDSFQVIEESQPNTYLWKCFT